VSGDESASRRLAALIALGIANHSVLTGSRVIVSLDALSMGASTFTVGVLISLYALLPMVLSVPTGRLIDRIGLRPPMLAGTVLIGAAATLAFAAPGMAALFGSATLLGTGFMAFQIAAQHATGELGGMAARARNFSMLALGYSVSGFIGPIIAGYAIDHFGFRWAFAIFALIPLLPIAVLASGRPQLPSVHPRDEDAGRGGVGVLLRHRTLQRVYAMNVLLALGWDLHTVFVPIYGAKIGLPAAEIGLVLSSFAAATFVVRFSMPVIARRVHEQRVLAVALIGSGLVLFAFPFSQNVAALIILSFILGLGLGGGQPVVLALLHTHAPPGRISEAVGVRMSLVNTTSVAVPLALGAAGASLGIVPVFWTVGAGLMTGSLLARKPAR